MSSSMQPIVCTSLFHCRRKASWWRDKDQTPQTGLKSKTKKCFNHTLILPQGSWLIRGRTPETFQIVYTTNIMNMKWKSKLYETRIKIKNYLGALSSPTSTCLRIMIDYNKHHKAICSVKCLPLQTMNHNTSPAKWLPSIIHNVSSHLNSTTTSSRCSRIQVMIWIIWRRKWLIIL